MIPIFSIIFAFGLPIFGIWRLSKDKPIKAPYLFSIASFIFYGIGMISEIITIKERLLAGDIGGIEDTIGVVIAICIFMLIVTALANLLLLIKAFIKTDQL